MKLKIKHNELRNLIRESVMEAIAEAESGGWVVDTNEAQEAYNLAAQTWGEEEINRQIVRAMGERALSECLAYIFRMNDFREWEEYKANKEMPESEVYENKMLNEYEGMDDSWSHAAVFGENQRDIYDILMWVKNAIQKKIRRGEEISKERLANSSTIFKAAQLTLKRFNEYNKDAGIEPFVMNNDAKRGLREYYAQKILNWIEEEEAIANSNGN